MKVTYTIDVDYGKWFNNDTGEWEDTTIEILQDEIKTLTECFCSNELLEVRATVYDEIVLYKKQ